jgi:hypothetical protein
MGVTFASVWMLKLFLSLERIALVIDKTPRAIPPGWPSWSHRKRVVAEEGDMPAI